ncbi:branched-chain amino acid ABC transporter substrate-binding protein [Endozoicomonas sp. OPT23]|uniref:ABC transporter substrate-binding protein n=1 Tax=Endozoicomonas sp. OPT23 TaxID=2072845 RepID=UPI00129AD156|nr:ABC transporter substrate-binding protein [Endozoicomonas sp. OPT23]MRI34115.1 branched-chain amino acid ABC transporter substrate-binding protein [Endozoicomonas sp. OPT23]
MQKTRILKASVIAAAVGTLLTMHANAKEKVFVGHLADYSGPTAAVGKHYADGIKDTLSWLNKNGGIDGTELEFESVDYAYKVPQAISNYKKWTSRRDMVAMQGWGTADTEALISFASKDKVAVFSASYSGHLTDPTGKNPKTKKPAPYNFFYGASYSDTCRALVQWAKNDWEQKGKSGKPGFVHIGDNHPYPNAPKKACAEYAREIGFDVKPPVVVSMKPGDFKAQCLSIKTNGANYGYVANLGGSVVSLIKSCDTVGTDIQLMANIWGGDKLTFEAVGEGIDNYVFPAMTPFWTDNVPALENVKKIARSSKRDDSFQTHHYIRGVCTTLYMAEAMKWAKDNGGITGENVKNGMYVKKNWVPEGMEGVCLPANWASDDHRGINTVNIYQAKWDNGDIDVGRISQVELPRRDDWLGY